VRVEFDVAGVNDRQPVVRQTDAAGEARFCYTGTVAGQDVIRATADGDEDGTVEAGEPTVAATKTYRPGEPTTLVLTPPTAVNTAGEEHCVTATLRDEFGNATPRIDVQFTVTGANNRGPSVRITDDDGQATFCYTGTVAGEDVIRAVADANDDGTFAATEPNGAATKTYEPGAPATLELSPKTAVNTVDDTHCVTATVRDEFGNPVPGVTVRFDVRGSTEAGGVRTTGRNGEAEFCYQGPPLPGADTITAYADLDRDGTQDAGEPFDVASKVWALPPSTELCEVKITNGGWIVAANGDRASFGGNAKSDEDANVSGQEQYTDHGPAEPLKVHSIAILAITCSDNRTEATIYGTAKINGEGEHNFRIRVRDGGEPSGRGDMYGILLDTGYYSGEQPLRGGNVQIH
jgi:hypothetical protein